MPGGPLSEEAGAYVQSRISCVAVLSPVPAVKPTYAAVPPTRPGMSTVYDCVALWSVTVSVIDTVNFVPS